MRDLNINMSDNQHDATVVTADLTLEKIVKCSFPEVKSQVKKPKSNRIEGNKISIELNDKKYMDCQAVLEMNSADRHPYLRYGIMMWNVDDKIKDIRVEGYQLNTKLNERIELLMEYLLMKGGDRYFSSRKDISYGELLAAKSKYLDKDGSLNLAIKAGLAKIRFFGQKKTLEFV